MLAMLLVNPGCSVDKKPTAAPPAPTVEAPPAVDDFPEATPPSQSEIEYLRLYAPVIMDNIELPVAPSRRVYAKDE